jgi:hypothetical protein
VRPWVQSVLDEGEDEWDLREGCSVQSGVACVVGFETLPPCPRPCE